MERHFVHDLEELKQRLLWMGSLAERAVHQAVQAVLDVEEHLAETVLEEENAINEMQMEIDDRVTRLLAQQQLVAIDLRFILAVSRINNDLERIGDQAVNIAQSALRILRHPQVKPYVDLPRMSEIAEGMVRDSLNALVRGDVDLARSVLSPRRSGRLAPRSNVPRAANLHDGKFRGSLPSLRADSGSEESGDESATTPQT